MDVAMDLPADEIIYVTAGIFGSMSDAETVLTDIKEMSRDGTIDVIDAAIVTKSADGKLNVEETKELTTRKGARRGAVIMGIFGLVFPPSLIASVIAGAGIGALAGRIRDTGIKKDQMQRIADQLEPGRAAVVVLAKAGSKGQIDDTFNSHAGQLITYDLGPDTSEDLATLSTDLPWAQSYWDA
jgi:uncharacterized membrane protein